MKQNPSADEEYGGKSRSRKKRESTALQQRGEELAALSPAVWKTLPLPPELAGALDDTRSMKTHEARRRHMQYIGRLMRELEEEERAALSASLDALKDTLLQDAAALHRIEHMRDALLDRDGAARDTALSGILAEHPELEPAKLRHLVDAALAEREKKRPPRHGRELFRYLRERIESGDDL
jgi:Uncharacterized protein conserved in bacteria